MADSLIYPRLPAAPATIKERVLDRPAPEPDASLLELEETYVARRLDLIHSLVKYGLDAIEAEDATQEAFLRGFDHCRKNKPIDNFFYWLLACARNLALNRVRHAKYELPEANGQGRLNDSLRTNSTPESELLEREEYDLLKKALSSLSTLERQCIMLRFQDVPFREVAVTLAISMRSAVYYTSTGIQKLRQKLAVNAR